MVYVVDGAAWIHVNIGNRGDDDMRDDFKKLCEMFDAKYPDDTGLEQVVLKMAREYATKVEREACAKIADSHDTLDIDPAYVIAEAIRNRP